MNGIDGASFVAGLKLLGAGLAMFGAIGAGVGVGVAPCDPCVAEHDAAGREPDERYAGFETLPQQRRRSYGVQRLHAGFDVATAVENDACRIESASEPRKNGRTVRRRECHLAGAGIGQQPCDTADESGVVATGGADVCHGRSLAAGRRQRQGEKPRHMPAIACWSASQQMEGGGHGAAARPSKSASLSNGWLPCAMRCLPEGSGAMAGPVSTATSAVQ